MIVFSIGHSNRTLEQFLELLNEHGIRTVADIRRLPGSTRYPHFDQESLDGSLAQEQIRYVHLPRLGGRRSGSAAARAQSQNDGWQNLSFQRYADYMQTEEFTNGIEELMALAAEAPTAMLCSEAVWWRCHRRLVADALVVRGVEVHHILSRAPAKPHVLTPFAHITEQTITYPAPLSTGEPK